MIKKFLQLGFLVILFSTFIFTSCEKDDIKDEVKRIDTLELWYTGDFPYGIVTITNDADNLYIKYEVYPELVTQNWAILQTYLFIGDYENLPLLQNGTVDWEQTDIEYCESGTTVFTRTISRESLTECFGIATKIKLLNPSDGLNPNPRALLLNDGNRGSYPWHENYKYCF